ncbi:MAG: HAD family phosphatase, partial [Bryobacterales bacterium]|nr:HAD family phosphatase [Bryobacterales bacterium]
MQKHYEAILFDFDGVLIDSEPIHFECWREVMRSVGVSLTRDIYESRLRGHSGKLLLEALCALRTPPIPYDEMLALYPVKNDL